MNIFFFSLQGLDKVGSGNAAAKEVQLRPLSSDLNPPRMDCYRFSMVNMEGEFSICY